MLTRIRRQAKGLGADNAPAHSEARAPGQAPVASDSGVPGVEGTAEEALENSGNINATNEPGMTGLKPAVPGGAAKGPNVAGA